MEIPSSPTIVRANESNFAHDRDLRLDYGWYLSDWSNSKIRPEVRFELTTLGFCIRRFHLHAQWLVSLVFQLGVLPGWNGPSNDSVADGFQPESDEWRIRVPIWSAHFPRDARGDS